MLPLWWRTLDNDGMVEIKLAVAVAGAIVLFWFWAAGRLPALRRGRRLRDLLLGALGLLSFACWFNLGHFHFNRFIHFYDVYHYYLGAKYAPELGYTRLYDCTVAAEDAYAHLGPRLERLKVRGLSDNVLRSPEAVLADPTLCTRYFTPARWRAFERDSDYFRRASNWEFWSSALQDHGYNGTPVWALTARPFASSAPASDAQLFRLSLLDPLLLVGLWLLIGWAFGWRAMCVALIFWGTNYPARYWWTGGAFLRKDWLFAAGAGICLMKKDHPFASGIALSWATLLRILPGFIVATVLLKILLRSLSARRLVTTAAQRRFIAGGLLAMAILVPAGGWAAGGARSYSAFVHNSEKHLSTPLTNNMGWKTVVAYSRATRAQITKDPSLESPFARWQADQHEQFRRRFPLYLVGLAGFVALLGFAVSRQDDWVAMVAGVGLILVAAQLTSYYLCVLCLLGLLWERLPSSGWSLALASAISCWIPLHLSFWDDRRFVLISAVWLVLVVAITLALVLQGAQEGDQIPVLVGGQVEPAGPIVEVDHVVERRRGTIVEVGPPRGQPT